MKKWLLFILTLTNIQVLSQVHLEIEYLGCGKSIEIEIYEFTDYIIPWKKKIAAAKLSGKTKPTSFHFDHIIEPGEILIIAGSVSKRFYVQPGNSYAINIDADSVSIESSDQINQCIGTVEKSIQTYYDQIFELDTDEDKAKMHKLFDDLQMLQYKQAGSPFQNQIIKYKLLHAQSVTLSLCDEGNLYRQLEHDNLLDNNILYHNPAYIGFLFDYYFRRLRQPNLRVNTYPDSMSDFEVIKSEVSEIRNDTIQQLAYLRLSIAAYNSSWVDDNAIILAVFDSLSSNGISPEIRNAANEYATQFSKLEPESKFPHIILSTLDGSETSLAQFAGKYLLLDFWFIGCRPCERAIPHKLDLYAEFSNQLEIISINSINALPDIAAYKSKKNLPWLFLKADANEPSFSMLNIRSYPTFYLLDKEQKIILAPKTNASMDENFEDIKKTLNAH